MFLKWIESLEDLTAGNLGPLQQLVGVWHGAGFTIIARPDGQHGQPFRLKLNTTKEILAFIPILGAVFNRGSIHRDIGIPAGNQADIKIHGLMYIQLIVDSENIAQVLHFETGQWLLVPETTTAPKSVATIVRQATILHGATFTATAEASTFQPTDGPPTIPDENSIPIVATTGNRFDLSDSYVKPYTDSTPPHGITAKSIINPNIIIQQEAQKLPSTTKTASVTLVGNIVSSNVPTGSGVATPNTPTPIARSDISNIPFLRDNADVQKIVSTFYVETSENESGEAIKQLQYTQNTTLRFDTIDWPHIAVATLRYWPFKEDLPGDIQGLLGRIVSLPTQP